MNGTRSHWGFIVLASKQLAGEWHPFKRQGDEKILTQLTVFPHRRVISTTSSQSGPFPHPNTVSQSPQSHSTQRNIFINSLVEKERGQQRRDKKRQHCLQKNKLTLEDECEV